MNLRLIEGRSVVDVFTLYAYIHVSLQITPLHVFPSKYNGKEIFVRSRECEFANLKSHFY